MKQSPPNPSSQPESDRNSFSPELEAGPVLALCKSLVPQLAQSAQQHKKVFMPPRQKPSPEALKPLQALLAQTRGATAPAVMDYLTCSCFPALAELRNNPYLRGDELEYLLDVLHRKLEAIPPNCCLYADWEMYEDEGLQVVVTAENLLYPLLRQGRVDLQSWEEPLKDWVEIQDESVGFNQYEYTLPIRERLASVLLLRMQAPLSQENIEHIYQILQHRPDAVREIFHHPKALRQLYSHIQEDFSHSYRAWMAESQQALGIPEIKKDLLQQGSHQVWARMVLTLGLPQGRFLLRKLQRERPTLGGRILLKLLEQNDPEVFRQADLLASLQGPAWEGREKLVRRLKAWRKQQAGQNSSRRQNR